MDCQTENRGFKRGWLDGAHPPDVFRTDSSFWKGNAVGVGQGRICNTALRIHVIVPRNCDR
ncbi:hypothetical protein DXB04_25640 [Enterocloster bolteae]|uniref:Uncharacterized protein n=1 Tax=Enterocloster bolteae TaxID=208479 RepID=A0A414ANH3_9FIRM|nr:hypothetical protein DXB04_25640 [Enterocloster bolteae]RHC51642.1 hypothetical protein DW839_24240 [Enterocloster bolteae]